MTTAASILYKFRSNRELCALPLVAAASGARLGFIKQLILQTNKLDQGRGACTRTTEMDLFVRDQNDCVVLDDDELWIPRGTRLVVERTYAARGKTDQQHDREGKWDWDVVPPQDLMSLVRNAMESHGEAMNSKEPGGHARLKE